MKSKIIASPSTWLEPVNVDFPIDFADSLALPDLVLKTIWRQGIRTTKEAHAFLDFRKYSPSSPYDLPGMEKGIERTIRAIHQGDLIGIWGDFDVDGQTSTSILLSALRKVGANVVYHVPVRGKESHGIKLDVLKKFVKQGVSLLITCDTGVSELESVTWAMQNHIDVVITDHHTLPENLPPAHAIINPQFLEHNHPMHPLPGAGTACQFARALLDQFNQSNFGGQLADLAALGIVADIAELRGECRYLVQSGIDLIRNAARPSLAAMINAAEINPSEFSEESISYALAPRMNAVGRLSDANPMVEFLLSEDPALLSVTVNQLEGLNARRKLHCDQVFQGAMDQIERDPAVLNHHVLMLSHPEWEAGVVGIVASRLVSIFQKPVILFVAPEGGLMRGSARSIEGINITAGIRQLANLLQSFGGHPMAAGLSLDPNNFRQFLRGMDQFVETEMLEHPISRTLQIDGWQDPSTVDYSLLEAIDRLAPFGAGNPPLIFAAKGLNIINTTPVGKTREHLQMAVEDNQGNLSKLIWWQGAGLPLPEGKFDLTYSARSSTWKGKPQIQLEWVDFRDNEPDKISLTSRESKTIDHKDFRSSKSPLLILKEIADATTGLIYLEGRFKGSISGKSRLELDRCDTLVMMSVPPSRKILEEILKKANPKKVIWFAQIPEENEMEVYVHSAAKLIKETLAQDNPKIDTNDLASRLSVTQETIEITIQWLVARGDISILDQSEGVVRISAGGSSDQSKELPQRKQLQKALTEIQSYRSYYQRAEIAELYGQI